MKNTKNALKRSKAKVEKPKRAGDVEREGKKSVPWQEDAEILQRLAYVATLMNQNKPSYLIAEKTKVSLATAKRDIARVRELWREDAKARLTNTADTAIAQYGAIIEKAWQDLTILPVGHATAAAYMNIILRAQERMDKVTGIADPIALEGKNGGPIEMSIVEIEKVRAERWKAIESKLVLAIGATKGA